MKLRKTKGGEIKGHLDIFIAKHKDEFEGKIFKRKDILIHGDPKGLRSFAKLLLRIADLDQEASTLPDGAREHYHLRPGWELSDSSLDEVIVGRLDAKGTGAFYDRFKAKSNKAKYQKSLKKKK